MTDGDLRKFVIAVVARKAGIATEQVSLNSRLVQDLYIDGDDAMDLILEISRSCLIDVSEFNASTYFKSEPSLLSLLPFLPSQKRNRLEQKRPLTVGELVEAVRLRKLPTE